MSAVISVRGLRKEYQVYHREGGFLGSLKSLFNRRYSTVTAVDGIGFEIGEGEIVGFLGPNGAGKTTTLKMLSGLLHPSSGAVSVLGYEPKQRHSDLLRSITLVMGQKQQLAWDLAAIDSFLLNRVIYDIPDDVYRQRIGELSEMLSLQQVLNKPVRKLSLGERMKCELALALLHQPKILFLDEPTIGLDVVAKERIRNFLAHMNRERGLTVILTTHDLADIAHLCRRVILIDHGRLVYDGPLETLRARYGRWRTLVVDLETPAEGISVPHAELVRSEGPRAWLRFDRDATTAAALIAALSARYPIRDLTVEEPEIETIIADLYRGGGLDHG